MNSSKAAYEFLILTKSLTIGISIILSIFLCIIGIAIVLTIEFGRRKQLQKLRTASPEDIPKYQITKKSQVILYILQAIALFIACMTAIYFGYAIQTYKEAKTHGMYQSIFDITWEKTINGIKLSPIEDTLPENKDDLKGSLIMYFKFGCPDCEAIYEEQQEKLKGINKLYWVSTRSEQGKELMQTFPVTEVPAGVYVKQNGTGVIETIYAKDANKNASLEHSKLNTLIDLYTGQN